jgi:hypothetical protein
VVKRNVEIPCLETVEEEISPFLRDGTFIIVFTMAVTRPYSEPVVFIPRLSALSLRSLVAVKIHVKMC